jgi:pyridinium-3,5-bisthiocarboxylic acid mononucleotide nickel chelatase
VRIALFDPFSGASGDMILGALIDAGLSVPDLRADLGRVDLSGYDLRVERVERHGLTGTQVTVDVVEYQPARDWREIRALLEASVLAEPVRAAALAVFARLAEAEGRVHGISPEEVHFHEVGGVDAIVDVCGACIGLARLGVERVFSGPPRVGTGFVRAAHGLLPVPAPATAALLAGVNAPMLNTLPGGASVEAELLTPTGAALLTTLAEFRTPNFAPSAIGYGFGRRELAWPNALRLWLGDLTDAESGQNGDLLLETNLDDLNPQFYELLVERLFTEGAHDAWLTPIQMKKGRPATMVSVLCPAARRRAIEDVLIENSTTLGVRFFPVERTKAARRTETVTTRWGEIRLKLRGWHGRVLSVAPEYDDCLTVARRHDVPIREVWNEAHRLGEAHVGRRWPSDPTQ